MLYANLSMEDAVAQESSLISVNDFVDLRRCLSAARDGGQPWFVLGETFAQALAAVADADLAGLRKAASEATKLSAGVLRRYVVLLDRLRTIAEAEGMPRDALVSRVFNAAEVAARIYDLDRALGVKSLTELKAGEITLVQLRERLGVLSAAAEARQSKPVRPSPESSARGMAVLRARELKRGFMLHALNEHAAPIWGSGTTVKRRPTSRFFTSHQGFEILTPDAERRAGLEMFILDGHEESELRYLEGVFPAYLTLATFYPKFYFLFSPSTPDPSVARAVDLLALFGANSIGVLRVVPDGRVETRVEPTTRPLPDRTADYKVLSA